MRREDRFAYMEKLNSIHEDIDLSLQELNELFWLDKVSETQQHLRSNLIEQYELTSRMLYAVHSDILETIRRIGEDNPFTELEEDRLIEIKEGIEKDLKLDVSINNYCVRIDLPEVNLHRKNYMNKPYFFAALIDMLKNFRKTSDYKEWTEKFLSEDMTIIFTHEYKEADMCIDNDNLDCKEIIDWLQVFGYIKSDRGDKLTHIHQGQVSERYHTVISLFPTSYLKEQISKKI